LKELIVASALNSLAPSKGDIRSQVRDTLKGFLTPEVKPIVDQQIQRRLAEILEQSNGPAALFHPFSDEPDLIPITASSNRRWAFPLVGVGGLEFFSFKDEPRWQKGSFGVLQPDPTACRREPIEEIEVVCVPGVAFDRNGVRLGRGRGHYDRALKNYNGTKVGVAYSAQIVNEPLPKESFDVPVNYICTENFLLKVKG
jgi:5-formyltetrahydrofolate cyclo-ligase